MMYPFIISSVASFSNRLRFTLKGKAGFSFLPSFTGVLEKAPFS